MKYKLIDLTVRFFTNAIAFVFYGVMPVYTVIQCVKIILGQTNGDYTQRFIICAIMFGLNTISTMFKKEWIGSILNAAMVILCVIMSVVF